MDWHSIILCINSNNFLISILKMSQETKENQIKCLNPLRIKQLNPIIDKIL